MCIIHAFIYRYKYDPDTGVLDEQSVIYTCEFEPTTTTNNKSSNTNDKGSSNTVDVGVVSTYSSPTTRPQPHTLLAIEDHKHHNHSKHHHNTLHKHPSKPTSSAPSSTTSHPTTPTTPNSQDPTTTATLKKATYLRKSVPLYQPPIPTLPKKNKHSSLSSAMCKDAMYIPSTMKIFTPHNYDPSSTSHPNPHTPVITDTYPSSSTPTTTSILQYENALVTTPNSDDATDTDNDWLRVADGLYESIVASKLALKQKLKDEFYGTKYSTKTKKNKGEKRGVDVDTLAKSDMRDNGHNSDLSPRPPSAPKPSSASINTTTARYQRRNITYTTPIPIKTTSSIDVDPLPLTDPVVETPATTSTTICADGSDLMDLNDTSTQVYDPTSTADMRMLTHTLAPSSSRSSSDSTSIVGRHNHQPSMPLTNRVAIDTNLLAWFCAHPRRHTLSSPPVTLHQPAVLMARRRIKQQYLTLGSVPGSLPATHRSTRVADND